MKGRRVQRYVDKSRLAHDVFPHPLHLWWHFGWPQLPVRFEQGSEQDRHRLDSETVSFSERRAAVSTPDRRLGEM